MHWCRILSRGGKGGRENVDPLAEEMPYEQHLSFLILAKGLPPPEPSWDCQGFEVSSSCSLWCLSYFLGRNDYCMQVLHHGYRASSIIPCCAPVPATSRLEGSLLSSTVWCWCRGSRRCGLPLAAAKNSVALTHRHFLYFSEGMVLSKGTDMYF